MTCWIMTTTVELSWKICNKFLDCPIPYQTKPKQDFVQSKQTGFSLGEVSDRMFIWKYVFMFLARCYVFLLDKQYRYKHVQPIETFIEAGIGIINHTITNLCLLTVASSYNYCHSLQILSNELSNFQQFFLFHSRSLSQQHGFSPPHSPLRLQRVTLSHSVRCEESYPVSLYLPTKV